MAPDFQLITYPPTSLPVTRSVATIGVFDGVHLGHRRLIGKVVERAPVLQARSVVLTFDPHPREVVAGARFIPHLTDLAERKALIQALGVDIVAVVHFTAEVAGLSAEDFLAVLQAQLHVVEMWVGPDFALGRGRRGKGQVLREIGSSLGYPVNVIRTTTTAGVTVSSSVIRRLLQDGQVTLAAELLGRPYSLEGTIVGGDRRGRSLGYPTANLELDPSRVVPADGVYVVTAVIGELRRPAVANIGVRPSFGQKDRIMEVHILQFEGDLYGQRLRVEFLERIRPERRFDRVEDLLSQLRLDVAVARDYHGLGETGRRE